MLKIGNITLSHGLILAPMADVTDRAMRKICVENGAEYTVTEMVSAKALHFDDKESRQLAYICDTEENCSVQIFGHEPDLMSEATEKLLTQGYTGGKLPSGIDINMGCPVKKVVSNGDGSALMRDPKLAGEIIRAVCDVSSVPVTVKIRAGWDRNSKNAVLMASIAEDSGASAVCIHGRTREEMYEPPVDTEIIASVKRAVKIPVIANGGIFTANDAVSMLNRTECDGIMIARGALGNPWIFSEISARMNGKAFDPPSLEVRIKTAVRQVRMMAEYKGEVRANLESRKYLGYYIKGTPGAAEIRNRLNMSNSIDESESILNDYLKKLM